MRKTLIILYILAAVVGTALGVVGGDTLFAYVHRPRVQTPSLSNTPVTGGMLMTTSQDTEFDGDWMGLACTQDSPDPIAFAISIDDEDIDLVGMAMGGKHALIGAHAIGKYSDDNLNVEFSDSPSGRTLRFSLVDTGETLSGPLTFVDSSGKVVAQMETLFIHDDFDGDLLAFYNKNQHGCANQARVNGSDATRRVRL